MRGLRGTASASRLTLLSLAVALAWSLGLALAHRGGGPAVLERVEAPLADLRYHLVGRRPPPKDVVVVAIDDATVVEAGRYPLPRAALADLVRGIAARRAATIAIDILLIDPSHQEADQALAAAFRAAPTVLATAAIFSADTTPGGAVPKARDLLLPMPSVREGNVLGTVNITTDPGGTPRHIPLLIETDGGVVASFVLRAAGLAAGRDPRISEDEVILAPDRPPTRLDLGSALPLRYFGPRGTIPTLSAARILRGEDVGNALDGKIAVIGATAIGSGDTFATPFDAIMPGVEILATGIAHLTSGEGLVRDRQTRLVDAAAGIALALATALLLSLAPPGIALGLVALAAVAWLAVCTFAFANGFWLSAAMPLAAMAPPALFTALARQRLERRRAGRVAASEAALRSFQPPRLADALEADPRFLAEPVAAEATVLFLDLTGFTGLSERLGPAATRDFLRGFHGEVEETVAAHGGVVVSFMGDGAMIVFGLPEPRPADAVGAVACAFALHRRIGEWMAARPPAALGIRVGAQRGPVVFSRLGAATHQQITATGDSVNVAARLLEVASREGAVIVLGASVIEAAAPPVPPFARREIPIRGREKLLTVALWREADLALLAKGPSPFSMPS